MNLLEMTEIDCAEGVKIRPGTVEDADVYWEWVNDPAASKSELDRETLSWDDHRRWFLSKIESGDCRIWTLEVSDVPAGLICYERAESRAAEIFIVIAGEFRRRRVDFLLLAQTFPLVAGELQVDRLRAVGSAKNFLMQEAFEDAGFNIIDEVTLNYGAYLLFEREC